MDTYPSGTVRALLASDAVTAPTRAALEERLEPRHTQAVNFLSHMQMALLRAVAARLVPQVDERIDPAAEIDARLAEGSGNGWRFASLPPDEVSYERGLSAVGQTAKRLHGVEFVALTGEQQDQVLRCVQIGDAPGDIWGSLDATLFFEELLADVVEAYYAHPIAQEEIGYAGMADARGWRRIGLDQLEEREPQRVTS